jgi:hydroxymethylbilane synthase
MSQTDPSDRPALRIGTRGSPLALAQAEETKQRLLEAHADLTDGDIEIVVISTKGDRIQDRALSEVGGKGLFTEEIEAGLANGDLDMAVHSMKDMPTDLPDGLTIRCYLPREDARDAFISTKAGSLTELPGGSVVGTSSLRRQAQVLHRRPDLTVVPFRGNVQTRLRKLGEGQADATFLALAGLRRLDMADTAAGVVEIGEMLPAVAQGAIGVEQRTGDERVSAFLAPLNDAETETRVACERAFLKVLDGSCRTPIAGHATLTADGQLEFHGMILRPDGSEAHAAERVGSPADAVELGKSAGAELRTKGGDGFFTD